MTASETERAAAKEILAAVVEEFWSMFPSGLVRPDRTRFPHHSDQIGINDAVTATDIRDDMADRYVARVKTQRNRREA